MKILNSTLFCETNSPKPFLISSGYTTEDRDREYCRKFPTLFTSLIPHWGTTQTIFTCVLTQAGGEFYTRYNVFGRKLQKMY